MKSYRKELWFNLPARRGFVNITPEVETCLRGSNIRVGLALCNAMHISRCGFCGGPKRECQCPPDMIIRYRNKISGPLLDRIDIHVEVPAVKYKEMAGEATGEPSEKIRARIARTLANSRLAGLRLGLTEGG